MKLIRFMDDRLLGPVFGLVINDHAVSSSVLQSKAGTSYQYLNHSCLYLANLPESEKAARELLDWGETHFQKLEKDCHALSGVSLLEPVDVAALYDFGLTPRHLRNSLGTMLKYEMGDPKTELVLQAAGQMLSDRPSPPPGQPEPLAYYKCNMNSISGDGATIPWPRYTSRLDIEPELAVVYGNRKQPVAGYCIFNDVSARDVQVPELIGGFCLSKDLAMGNQLGPWMVTADEVDDPFQLNVAVKVNGSEKYRGSTAEITHRAEDIFAYLATISPIKPGSVMGFGTIPDCTGLDHDNFVDPGAEIEIRFENIGTLRCRFSVPEEELFPSRWPLREALKQFHGE